MPVAPGVYLEQRVRAPAPELRTAVPAFLGTTTVATATSMSAWGGPESKQLGGYLRCAVRGFFDNGGERCWVVPAEPDGIDAALSVVETLDEVDLICAPDLATLDDVAELSAAQASILSFCAERALCFAILDAVKYTGQTSGQSRQDQAHEHRETLGQAAGAGAAAAGALYFPWIKDPEGCQSCRGTGRADQRRCGGCGGSGARFVPPCGHVAGVYARSDQRAFVHKPPANEPLLGTLDLESYVSTEQQGPLNSEGINCLRAIPGRGVRVWGARTLSRDPAWVSVSARRLFLTVGRSLRAAFSAMAFEPNNLTLWVRASRDLSALMLRFFERGAFAGGTPAEAFFVKCDAETNPPDSRALGQLVAEIDFAPVRPSEFVRVRLSRSDEGRITAAPSPG